MMTRTLALLAILLSVTVPALAQTRVEVTKGQLNPTPIAIVPFYGTGGGASIGQQMSDVITNDLKNSGLFNPIPPASFIQDNASLATSGPRYPEWKTVGAQALVGGSISGDTSNLRIEFRLFDVFAQKQLIGTAYTANSTNWRRVAHLIADDIYERITGEKGYFDTRIAYVAESGPATARVKRLSIMDYDGFGSRYLTDGRNMVLTPRFSPDGKRLTYMSYEGGTPKVYLLDVDSGRQSLLGNFPGMTFAPRFSPDGASVVYSQLANGNTDLYKKGIGGGGEQRLTSDPNIDTAPSYSPDGRSIAFESDRSGTQQIYVMDASGGNQRRISFGDGRYASPVWSPRGDLIAFTKLKGGQFYIGVIKPDGSGERLITSAFHVEGPSWAPNGRYLTYFKEVQKGGSQGRAAQVYTIDLTGYNERVVQTPSGASDPSWSGKGAQ